MGGVSIVHWLVLLLPVAAIVGVILLFARKRDTDLTAPPSAVRPTTAAARPRPAVPAELETRLWVLIRDGDKIQAVKMVREELGLDLHHSKQVVDDVERRLPRGPG